MAGREDCQRQAERDAGHGADERHLERLEQRLAHRPGALDAGREHLAQHAAHVGQAAEEAGGREADPLQGSDENRRGADEQARTRADSAARSAAARYS